MSAVEEFKSTDYSTYEHPEEVAQEARAALAEQAKRIAELEAERDALRLVNEKQSEQITDLKASEEWYKAGLEGTTAKMEYQARRAEKAEAEVERLRDYSERLRRAGIALALRLARAFSGCPYPDDCGRDCPPPGARAMCWLRWATEQSCPAHVGCGGECADCDLAARFQPREVKP